MKAISIIVTLLLWFPACASRAATEPVDPTNPVDAYIALSIQGDLSDAVEWFARYPPEQFPELASLAGAFHARFSQGAPTTPAGTDGLAQNVVTAYASYWKAGLLDPDGAPDGERRLFEELSAVLPPGTGDQALDAETIRPRLEQALTTEGLHVFEGPTLTLRDLFLWQTQHSRPFEVQLTDGVVEVTVHFMDDFLVQGWKDYASLGLATTTGWVEDGELYCLAWAYDTGSENFEVSYLQHEARHLADLERYPGMGATELEYRAKLTELAFANRTLERILEDFTAKAAENPASPHAMANWRVVRDVYWSLYGSELPEDFAGWGTVRTGQVNRVARQLLDASNRRLQEG